MQERTRLLERVLGLAGLEPSVPQQRFLRGANPLFSNQVRAARSGGKAGAAVADAEARALDGAGQRAAVDD